MQRPSVIIQVDGPNDSDSDDDEDDDDDDNDLSHDEDGEDKPQVTDSIFLPMLELIQYMLLSHKFSSLPSEDIQRYRGKIPFALLPFLFFIKINLKLYPDNFSLFVVERTD